MNMFSLLGTIAICITVAGLPYILSIYPITIKFVRKEEYDGLVTPSNTVPEETFVKQDDKPISEKAQELKHMDSVIAAVNDLFGVGTEENADGQE